MILNWNIIDDTRFIYDDTILTENIFIYSNVLVFSELKLAVWNAYTVHFPIDKNGQHIYKYELEVCLQKWSVYIQIGTWNLFYIFM